MPTLTLQSKGSTGGDTFIFNEGPNENRGLSTQFEVGWINALISKGLLRFDLSALPIAGTIIQSAFLTLQCIGEDTSSDRGIAVTRALTQWYEGDVSSGSPVGSGSTWNKRNHPFSVNWSGNIAGGQPNVDYVTSPTSGAVTITGPGSFTWTVTNDVQHWASGNPNYGWWLLNSGTDTDARKAFASFEHGTALWRPKLVINYTSSQSVAPAARSAVAGRAGPTVVKGSISQDNKIASAGSGTAGPSMINIGYTLEPAPAEAPAEAVMEDEAGVGGMTFLGGAAEAAGEATGPEEITISAELTASPASAGANTLSDPSVKGSMTFEPAPAEADGETVSPASLVDRTLRPAAATAVGATVGKAKALRIYPIICTPAPILHITDGTVKNNGQRNLLDLLGRIGFILNNWNPNIAQYKDGGTWSDSAMADGRFLARKAFANGLEVFDLKGKAQDQDAMIKFIRELFMWQELASSYWVSDWATRPVYLAAKAARETEIRYAVIHTMSIPELNNPYSQPFFTRRGVATLEGLTLRVERGPWASTPPGLGDCVPMSSVRSWTIQGWQAGDTEVPSNEITGSVRAMVQANNGDILAGVNTDGGIYRSTDGGATWLFLTRIGPPLVSNVSINSFVKDNSGNIFAAVDGSHAASQGIWRSTNNGVSWTRVKSHPSNTGYLDITAAQGSRLVAVGHPVASGSESPIVASNDGGNTWTNVSTSYWNQKHMSVAAYPEPVLFTQYPQELYGSVFTFYGTDTYYTAMGGVGGNPPSNYGFGTLGGGAGNGGLDMVSFLVSDGNGRYFRRALWAVKSAADVTDTEVWQWPSGTYQSGSTQFSKISTIDSKLFNVMYVDPVATWQQIGAARTIWAGANGEIYVSYNNGLSWALATNAPVNQIRSFLRTKTGVLLAGGDNGEIFVYNGDSGSQGGGTSTGTPAGGSIVVNSHPLGREETCDDEVFASNKSSFNNITHVLHYNGSTYNELQFAALPPYALLGDTAGVNKAVYFGSKTSDANVPGGTFSSVIFDITRIAENLTLLYEYWNGSAWVDIPAVQDSSAGFKILGVGSIHWVPPSGWATTAVNGITGYWIRVKTSAVGSDPVTPLHDNRFIYTSNLPYVEIADNAVGGDLPAAAQIRWHNRADDPAAVLGLEVDRIVCGLRSVNRGSYFNAYLNISDLQIPFGVSIAKNGVATWGASVRAPTNRALSVSYSSGGDTNIWQDLVVFSLSNTIARDYYGTYRAFVRCYKYGTGSNNWQLRLRTAFGSGGSQAVTKAVFPTPGNDWEILDLGQVSIPTTQVSFLGNNLGDKLEIAVQGYCTTTGIGLTLYDLILIPTDEWAVDSRSPEPSTSDVAKVRGSSFLDIDSVTNPKVLITATNRTSADLIVSRYQAITNGPAMLQAGQQQRLWFLVMSYENYWASLPEVAGSVQGFKQQRYLGPRGVT